MSVSLRPVSPPDLAPMDRWGCGMSDHMSRTRPLLDGADHHDPASGLFWYVIAEADRDVGTPWIEPKTSPSGEVVSYYRMALLSARPEDVRGRLHLS